ncbi:kinase-like protein [Trichoderma citrinoviride]|uniref:Kinase-like protein n=1 Tax=Trichoderma citrinoviride TaxID=58853 RepID=A0A2T4BCM1_9HYPO|nr:kinase-like protein [Trichoderma citrinoviride]PTB66949.1 kinase-like protein [Trichoderma citrinoviride]
MPLQTQDISAPAYSPSIHSSASETQIDSRAAGAGAGAGAAEQGEEPTGERETEAQAQPHPDPSPKCPKGQETAPVATDDAKSKAPTVDQIRTLLDAALPSAGGARLLIASPQYPNDASEDSPIVRLSHEIEGRVTSGVVQNSQHMDYFVQQPLQRGSTAVELCYEITFIPGSDDCLLKNCTNSTLQLTCLDSRWTRWLIRENRRALIRPGLWRIFLAGDEDDASDSLGTEILLLKRQYTVAIHKAIDSPLVKRAANKDDAENPRKRRKLGNDEAEGVAVPLASKTAPDSESIAKSTETVHSHHLTASSVREIVNPTGIPLLELTDKETAVISTLHINGDALQPISVSTAKSTDSYHLSRIQYMGHTPSTSVFSCRHSAIPGLVVAKVPRYDGKSIDKVPAIARSWKRERDMLKGHSHRNIVALKAVDARMFALYLEVLPRSLYRGNTSTFMLSDVATVLSDMASALVYLCDKSIIHNDIKPGNIAFSPQRGAVLFDFGMATNDEDQVTGGTMWYLPPDIIHRKRRGFPGDVWALGITMVYLLGKMQIPERCGIRWDMADSGKKKGSDQAMMTWFNLVKDKREELDRENKIESIVYDMLHWKAEARITAEGITAALDALKLDSPDNQTCDERRLTRSQTRSQARSRSVK